ncbi:oligosaccharide flippase family protein [uncultured Acetobacteroides sp.]|uniref:oligosaccharide flippase family protein n=1 Tax=uncultured Acetobacteroides sp. TaxID=1760811 RepID=UPI0029F4C119|nr:oligosaccharide flippase family protein [uncultured Acetobacteroides sp.]
MISIGELQRLIKSDFTRNVGTLFTGNGISMAVNLLSLPILSRLYTPEEFGSIALYVAIAQLIAVFVSGRYDYALMLPRKSGEALKVALSGVVLSFYMSILVAVVLYFSYDRLLAFFPHPTFARLIWLLPIIGFLLSVRQILSMWFSRRSRFKFTSQSKVLQTVVANGVRLPRAIYANGVAGLWLGFVVSELVALVQGMFFFWKHDYRLLRTSKKTEFKETLAKYASFPMYSMPISFLNSISTNLLIYAFSYSFSASVVGLYERFSKMISVPLDMVSSSFSIVFFQKMSFVSSKRRFYRRAYLVCLLIGGLMNLPVVLWGPKIFSFVLGGNWQFAGEMARYLAPLMVFGFANKCIGTTFSTINKNGVMLVWQLSYLVLTLGWVVVFRDHSVLFIIKTYALLGALLNIVLGVYGYYFVKKADLGTV